MSKKIPFILNDPTTKNSHGFYVDTSGISLDRFLKNPVCLKDHSNKTQDVLGTWTNLHVENNILKGRPEFDTKDVEGLEVVRKVENRIIKGSSLGLGLGINKPNFKMIDGRLTLVSSELKEISIVPVGSSGNTISLYDEEGTLLSDDKIQEICLSAQKTLKTIKTTNMKLVTEHLQLADDAPDSVILAAVKEIEIKLAAANTAKNEIKLKYDGLVKEKEIVLKEEFKVELAAAQKDGRIDASAAPTFEKLAEANLADTLEAIKNLPKRASVTPELSEVELTLASFEKMTWDELDKGNHLVTLKANHKEYYQTRFKKQFPDAE